MTQTIKQLDAAELALVAGGVTEGGCVEPRPTSDGQPKTLIAKILDGIWGGPATVYLPE